MSMAENIPQLTVIMTVYNGEAFLQETLDAVFTQTFADFEMVVVNNGCTDRTQAILDGVNDDRLRVIQAPSHGTFGDGIRLAYKNATGPFIAVQDGDDVPMSDRFDKQVAALMADDQLGLVSSAFEDIDQDGNHLDFKHPPTQLQGLVDALQTSNPMAHSTYMYRKAASDAVGGYPTQYAYGPDFALVIRLIKAGWRVRVLDDVLLKLRQHVGQASLAPALGVTRAHDAYYLYQEASGLGDVSISARRAGARNITKCRARYALALMGEGRHLTGWGQLFAALARHPLYGAVYLGYRLGRRLGLLKPTQA